MDFYIGLIEHTACTVLPGASFLRRLRQAGAARDNAPRTRRRHFGAGKRARGERGAAAGHPRAREDGGVLHAGGRQRRRREHLPPRADGRDARLVGQRRQREVPAGEGGGRRGRKRRLGRGNARCRRQGDERHQVKGYYFRLTSQSE